jgi:hypothetical protein
MSDNKNVLLDPDSLEEVISLLISEDQTEAGTHWRRGDIALQVKRQAEVIASERRLSARDGRRAVAGTLRYVASQCRRSESYVRQHAQVAEWFTREHRELAEELEWSFFREAVLICPDPRAAWKEVAVAADRELSIRDFRQYLLNAYKFDATGLLQEDGEGGYILSETVNLKQVLDAYKGKWIRIRIEPVAEPDV